MFWARLVLVGAVFLLGLGVAAYAWDRSERDARASEAARADRVAETIASEAATVIAGLGGAAGLVAETGPVQQSSFVAFRDDVAGVSTLETLAYVPIVEGPDRAAFEADLGRPISVLGPASLEPSPERDEYWPVQWVVPVDPITELLYGIDVASSDISARESAIARDTGDTVVTEPVVFDDGSSLFFIIKPLYRPGDRADTVEARRAAHAGFVASAFFGSSLVTEAVGQEPGSRVRLLDGDQVLAQSDPSPEGRINERTVDVGGRRWTVEVADDVIADHDLSWFLVTVTALLSGALLVLVLRGASHDRSMNRVVDLVSSTAELGHQLASAATLQEVAGVIGEDVAPALGASTARLTMVDHGADPTATSTTPADQVIVDAKERRAVLPIDAGDGATGALVEIEWSDVRFDDPMLATLRTLAELCEQTFRRAAFTDLVAVRSDRLARLAESLAGAATLSEVASAITEAGRLTVGASAASLGVVDEQRGVLAVHHGDTVGSDIRDRFADPPLASSLAFTDAARTGEPVMLSDGEEYHRRYPSAGPQTASLGGGARAAMPLRDGDRSIGALVFAWPTPRIFDDALQSTLWTIAEMATQSVTRASLSEAQVADARHDRDLALFAERLAGQARTDDVIQELADGVAVPLDASSVAIGVLDHGELVALATHRMDDDEATGMVMASAGFSEPFLGPAASLDAAATLDRPTTTDRGGTTDDAVATDSAAARPATFAVHPLHGRDAATTGVLVVGWDDPVDDDDELRDRLTTIAGIAGQTIERSQLVERLRSSVTRNEALADFAQAVARVRTVDELAEAVVGRAGAPVGAMTANVGLVDDDVVSAAPRPPFASGGVDQFGVRALEQDLPGMEAIRNGSAVVLDSVAAIAERYPGRYHDAVVGLGATATAHLPLLGADSTPLGAIGFAWSVAPDFSATDLATLRTIAELISQTLERVRLGEAEHHLVASLQHRVITPLVVPDGLEIADRYRPSAAQVGMGGDWFEGMTLDDGRYLLVIGDIAGHGITAVADMIQVRSIITTLVRSGVPLGDVFTQASRLLSDANELVTASVGVVVVDLRASELRYVAAGHPPMLLTRPDGSVEVLEGGRQSLLGLPISHVEPGVVEFEPGATLTAYTDGLIERRTESIDESTRHLVEVVTRSSADPVVARTTESLLDAILRGCLRDDDPDDDVAVVLIRRSVPAARSTPVGRSAPG